MEKDKTEQTTENESEVVKALREKYEAMLQDKDKIIKQLIDKPIEAKEKAEEKDEEAKEEKDDEEARRKKRFDYYKKFIR